MDLTCLTVVCLPHGTPIDRLAEQAAICLTATGLTDLGTARHFRTATRLRRGSLLQPGRHHAAGGPVQLLDLSGMREAARRSAWQRWHLWQHIVAGTRPARPYWTFLERHRNDPRRYPLRQAHDHYLAQPRIAAMRTYNALPHRITTVPTSHLEALQTGPHSYTACAWLHAVPGDGVLCLDGRYLTPASDRYADRITYLAEANRSIDALHGRDLLVARCTR